MEGRNDSSSDSSDLNNSINLSDIKSENESIYWEEQRGVVDGADVLIGNEKLYDHEFVDEFKENLRQLEKCLIAPQVAIKEFEQKKRKSQKNIRR